MRLEECDLNFHVSHQESAKNIRRVPIMDTIASVGGTSIGSTCASVGVGGKGAGSGGMAVDISSCSSNFALMGSSSNRITTGYGGGSVF